MIREKLSQNKRLILVLVAALLLLAGAIWLNVRSNEKRATNVLGTESTPSPTDAGQHTSVSVYNDYFSSFRSERSSVRAQEIEYLRTIINSSNADAAALSDAQSRLLELVNNMEKEFTIESRIRAKGFLDAAVTFQGGSVTVVIDGENLSDEEVAKILDIVTTESGMPASNIKIYLGG